MEDVCFYSSILKMIVLEENPYFYIFKKILTKSLFVYIHDLSQMQHLLYKQSLDASVQTYLLFL